MKDTRLTQARALIREANQLITTIDDEGNHTPVDSRRLQHIHQYLTNALASMNWLDNPTPQERRTQ